MCLLTTHVRACKFLVLAEKKHRLASPSAPPQRNATPRRAMNDFDPFVDFHAHPPAGAAATTTTTHVMHRGTPPVMCSPSEQN